MSDSNLDDVLGVDAKEVKTETKPKSAPKTASKPEPKGPVLAPAPVRVNPIPLVTAQGDLLPGDDGFNYASAMVALQEEILQTSKHSAALAAASRDLHLLRSSKAPVKTDHERYLENKANVERIRGKQDERKGQVRAVLSEMGLL